MKRCVLFPLVMLFVAGIGFESAAALPRFASRNGAKCQSCHVNPSGGGMRQAFGVRYGRDELPVPTWSQELGLDDFSTELSDVVSIGADFRTLFYYQDSPGGSTNELFQMQGNLYTNVKLAKKVHLYLAKGLYDGFEIFGLLNILPANGHLKVGKFIPNYGMKLDDHRTFIRQETGFSPERGRPERTGGELAFSPGALTFVGGVYNTDDSRVGVTGNSNKALLVRAEGMFSLSEDSHLGLGANAMTRRSTQGMRTTLFGGFGSFSYANFTLLGEGDLIRNTGTGVSKDSTGVVLYLEAGYVVVPGVDLKFIYDYFDPDKDLKSGSISRYSMGFEFFPLSGVEVRPLYRISREEPVNVDNNEFQLLIHFYL